MEKFDVIVIGAGPAGCFAATELKRRGYSVCILEKEERGHRKVCGDGLSMAGMEVLRMMDFPVERIPAKGAFRIQHYYYYAENRLIQKEVEKPAYCLARNLTDELFQEYAQQDFHIPIRYGCGVKDIVRMEGGYAVNGVHGRKVLAAVGANARIRLDGRDFLCIDRGKPVGISCIIKGKPAEEGFFFFDYDAAYEGTYAWIFTLGRNLYNVGLWRKAEYGRLKNQLAEFMEKRCPEWTGAYEVVRPPKGAFMGIGSPVKSREDGIFLVGDAANTSNEMDGEGISRAIISAREIVETYF